MAWVEFAFAFIFVIYFDAMLNLFFEAMLLNHIMQWFSKCGMSTTSGSWAPSRMGQWRHSNLVFKKNINFKINFLHSHILVLTLSGLPHKDIRHCHR